LCRRRHNHHLRHTFATLAISGLDPATVQTLMGHSKITTTGRYLDARPLIELAERMDAIFAVGIEAGTGNGLGGAAMTGPSLLGMAKTVRVEIDSELLSRLRARHPGRPTAS
jgi:hypothetical protein